LRHSALSAQVLADPLTPSRVRNWLGGVGSVITDTKGPITAISMPSTPYIEARTMLDLVVASFNVTSGSRRMMNDENLVELLVRALAWLIQLAAPPRDHGSLDGGVDSEHACLNIGLATDGETRYLSLLLLGFFVRAGYAGAITVSCRHKDARKHIGFVSQQHLPLQLAHFRS
jgi:hypothetical protein